MGRGSSDLFCHSCLAVLSCCLLSIVTSLLSGLVHLPFGEEVEHSSCSFSSSFFPPTAERQDNVERVDPQQVLVRAASSVITVSRPRCNSLSFFFIFHFPLEIGKEGWEEADLRRW